jgi:hypothetical protein
LAAYESVLSEVFNCAAESCSDDLAASVAASAPLPRGDVEGGGGGGGGGAGRVMMCCLLCVEDVWVEGKGIHVTFRRFRRFGGHDSNNLLPKTVSIRVCQIPWANKLSA